MRQAAAPGRHVQKFTFSGMEKIHSDCFPNVSFSQLSWMYQSCRVDVYDKLLQSVILGKAEQQRGQSGSPKLGLFQIKTTKRE